MPDLAPALLAACLLASALPADPLKDFQRAFKPSRKPELVQEKRAAAIEAVAGIDSPEMAEALLKAYLQLEKELAEPEERHREHVERGFREKREEQRLELDPLRDLQEGVLTLLRAIDAPASVAPLVEEALLAKKMPLTLRLELAGRAGDVAEQAAPWLEKAAKKSKPPAAVLTALEAARSLGPAGGAAIGTAISGLGHPDAAVRETAARALAVLASPDSIRPLIERIDREHGRVREAVVSALQVVTRQRIGGSSRAWRAWLEKEGGPFVDGTVELGGGEPVVAGGDDAARYFDIPLDGESILFLIDRSKSMNASMKKKPKGGERPAGETRMQRAKTELVAALGHLRPGQRFNVLTFAGSIERFAPQMVLAEPDVIAEAQEWVRGAKLQLGTRAYDALEMGFATAGRPWSDDYYDSAADTFFVLTDGRPIVSGKNDKTGRILAAVRRWNLLSRVTVHVVGLGDDVPKGFLKKLATQNGGRFVHEESSDEEG